MFADDSLAEPWRTAGFPGPDEKSQLFIGLGLWEGTRFEAENVLSSVNQTEG